MAITIDEGYEGYPATWFYLDRPNGTLSERVPAGSFAASDVVNVSLSPRYFNAPGRALGATDETQFLKQGKPSAYLKTQLDQNKAGTSTKPLTFVAMYPIVDNPNDDINSTFFSDPGTGNPLQDVPLPGGSGRLRTPVTAIVGGAKPQSSLLTIITQVVGLTGGPAVTALFPIAAADRALASTVESLINSAVTAFAPQTKQQYWINDVSVPIAANQASAQKADSDTLQLITGTTHFAVFPTGDGGKVEAAVKTIASQADLKFDLDRGGALVATRDGAVVSPNPFASLIYVTYRASVLASA